MQTRKEPHGQRHRVYVIMHDVVPDDGRIPPPNTPGDTESMLRVMPTDNVSLAVAQERVRSLEELVGILKEQLQLERERYTGLLNDLRTGKLVLAEPERQRPWWRFWTGMR